MAGFPRFSLTPEQLNSFAADDWANTQNQKLADDWAAQQTASIQPPDPGLTTHLGGGAVPSEAGTTEPPNVPTAPPVVPEPPTLVPAPTEPSPGNALPAPDAPITTPLLMPATPAPPDETLSNPFGDAFRQLGGVTAPPPAPVAPIPQPIVATVRPTATPAPATSTVSTSPTPLPTGNLVDYARQAAQKVGIDPDLFVRQINQESGFDPHAGSPAGAQGIAQIVPKYHPGVNTADPLASLDYAANLMKSHLATYGGDIQKALVAYNGGQGAVQAMDAGHIYSESQDYLNKILGTGGSGQTMATTGAPVTANLSQSQFGDRTLTADEAYAACGPAAAVRLAALYGNNIPLKVALDAAKQVGWTAAGGMAGIASEKKLMDALGLPAELDTSGNTDRILSEAGAGRMVTISTPGHYFSASGTRQRADGQTELYVGQSGQDLKNGKPWMTLGEIEQTMGKIGGALFSDPSKAVAAGDWMQTAAQQHGSPLETPEDAIGQLTQARQKAGLPPVSTSQSPDETVSDPFGEAFRQLGNVAGQAGNAIGGALQGANNAVRSAIGADQPQTMDLGPSNAPGAAFTPDKVASATLDALPRGTMLSGGLNTANAAIPATGDEPTMRTGGQLLGQYEVNRAADDQQAQDLLGKLQARTITPEESKWLNDYMLSAAMSVAGEDVNLKGGLPGGVRPQTSVPKLSQEELITTHQNLGDQWQQLDNQAADLEAQSAQAFNPGLKARYQNEADRLRTQQDQVMQKADYLVEHGSLPPETSAPLPEQPSIPQPQPDPATSTVPRNSPSNTVGQSAILSSPNYRRLQAMRGTPEQVAQLRPAEEGFAGNINLDKVTPDSVKAALQRTMDSPSTNEFAGQRRGVITDVQAQENAAAKALTMAPQDWIKTKPGRAFNQEEATALGNQMVKTGNEYADMRAELQASEKAGTATDLQRAAVADKSLEFALLEGVRSGAAAEAGRALRSFRTVMDGALRTGEDTSKALRTAFKTLGGEDAYAEWAQKWGALEASDTVGKYRMLQALHSPSRMNRLVAWTTSNMLSGSKTLEVNLTGGAIETLNRPAIELLGGRPVDAWTDLTAMGRAFGEAWGNASTALTTGVRPSQAARALADPTKYDAVRPEAFAGKSGLVATPALRVMSATDEFMRTLNAAGALAVAARREARATGKSVQSILSEPPDHVLKFAQDAADTAIFEGPGSPVSAAIIKWRNLINSANPTERAVGVGANVLFPFVHIPEQILIRGTKMLPGVNELTTINSIRKGLQSGDKQAVRDAVGKYVLTDAVLLAAGSQVLAGNITGMGPKDAGKRAALDAARDDKGNKVWQAHSVRIGDRWVDYTNLGPVAIPLAVLSNAHEAYLESGKKPDANTVADVFNKVAATMMDATYINGFGDLMKGISEGRVDKAAGSLIGNTITRFVPYGGMLSQVQRTTDQETKNPRNLPEYVASRVPIASELVADKPSPFGGPVQQPQDVPANLSPFKTSAAGMPDPVAKAFVDAGMGAPSPSSTVSVRNEMTGSNSPPISLTEDEKLQYSQILGERLRLRITPMVSSSAWTNRTIQSRAAALDAQLQAARDYTAAQIISKMPAAERQRRMQEGRQAKIPTPIR